MIRGERAGGHSWATCYLERDFAEPDRDREPDLERDRERDLDLERDRERDLERERERDLDLEREPDRERDRDGDLRAPEPDTERLLLLRAEINYSGFLSTEKVF